MRLVRVFIAAIVGALAFCPAPASAKEYRSLESHEFSGNIPAFDGRTTVIARLHQGPRRAARLRRAGPVSNLQWQTIAVARAKDRWRGELHR